MCFFRSLLLSHSLVLLFLGVFVSLGLVGFSLVLYAFRLSLGSWSPKPPLSFSAPQNGPLYTPKTLRSGGAFFGNFRGAIRAYYGAQNDYTHFLGEHQSTTSTPDVSTMFPHAPSRCNWEWRPQGHVNTCAAWSKSAWRAKGQVNSQPRHCAAWPKGVLIGRNLVLLCLFLSCPRLMITHIFIIWELISQLHRTSVTHGSLAGIILCNWGAFEGIFCECANYTH